MLTIAFPITHGRSGKKAGLDEAVLVEVCVPPLHAYAVVVLRRALAHHVVLPDAFVAPVLMPRPAWHRFDDVVAMAVDRWMDGRPYRASNTLRRPAAT